MDEKNLTTRSMENKGNIAKRLVISLIKVWRSLKGLFCKKKHNADKKT